MSDGKELFSRAYQILYDRSRWELKQRLFYQMRHDGIRRRNKPFANAADLHLALIDEQISKLKPFWLAQALNSERLAFFVSMRQQLESVTQSAADFFDFELRQRTNFERKLETCVDTMLLRGRGCIKNYVDPFHGHRLVFENVDPMFILIADTANDFDDADEFVHVRQISLQKWKADPRWDSDPATIAKIRGSRDKDFETIFDDKELREGITHSRRDDTIVCWEHYVKTLGGWTVYSYIPQATEICVRKPYGVPYKVGGQVSCPFFSFVAEVKDEGWYSPRGIAEKIAPLETYGSKMWNAKADAITFFNTPVTTSETPIQNPANYRWQPGEYVPGNLKTVQMGQPAMSFDEEINFTRGEAEQQVQSPDFGIQRSNPRQGTKPRTARENERIASLQDTSTSHNASIFRGDACKLYRHSWGLMLQYKRQELTYFIANDLQTLPEQAMHDQYMILPAGAGDDWNRNMRLQKATGRFQTFKGAPNIDQDELARGVIAADDPRLVAKLLIPTKAKAGKEAEDEAMEIVILADGFPAEVLPGEDHATWAMVLAGWLQKQGLTRQPVDPVALQRIQQHLAMHLQYLKKLQPQAFKQVMMQIKQMEQQPLPPQVSAPMTRSATAGPPMAMPQRRIAPRPGVPMAFQ